MAFFESVRSHDVRLVGPEHQSPIDNSWNEKAKETSLTLKLVSDLLDRGHGVLAGKMARKAFLLLEDVLTLEGPALIWNLLEIMHHMLQLRHERLFKILLTYLAALSSGRLSNGHPLSAMLHDLQKLVTSVQTETSTADNSSSKSSSSSPSSIDDNIRSTDSIASLIEEAWKYNAEIVLSNFDPRLFQLYFHLYWESTSIPIPSAIIDTVRQWLPNIDKHHKFSVIADATKFKDSIPKTSVEANVMLQRLLAPRLDASPPQNYEMLRESSTAALREVGEPILREGSVVDADAATTLRIMPALVKARILEEAAAVMDREGFATGEIPRISRSQAANVACIIRALMDLKAESDGSQSASPGAVERIRSIVALREYAYGEVDPQVIREMWLLEDALVEAGEREKAQEVGQSVLSRIEQYTQDVPIDSA